MTLTFRAMVRTVTPAGPTGWEEFHPCDHCGIGESYTDRETLDAAIAFYAQYDGRYLFEDTHYEFQIIATYEGIVK